MSAESDERDQPGPTGLPDALRSAVEKTFAATSESRVRAHGLIRKGSEAREVSAGAASRVADAADRFRVAGRDEVRRLEAKAARLEDEVKRLAKRVEELESKPKVED